MLIDLLKKGLDSAIDKLIEYEYGIPKTIQYTPTSEDPEVIDRFNSDVASRVKSKMSIPQVQIHSHKESLFASVDGYNDIKELMMRCITSKEPSHIILDGTPASGKTMFLLAMQNSLDSAYFVDCTNASGPGMIEYLFNHDVKYLLLDEVEKMSKRDQNVLLNLMETGILTSTKVKKTYCKKMNIWVFATTNDIDTISKPFRSRFMEFTLLEYTFNEFDQLAVKLLSQRYGQPTELAHKVADIVWNKIKSKDCRDILQIGKLSRSIDDVEFVATTLQKYKRKKE